MSYLCRYRFPLVLTALAGAVMAFGHAWGMMPALLAGLALAWVASR